MNAAATLLEQVPSLRRRISPVSVAEYGLMGELNENRLRTELIRGVIIEKVSKSPAHSIPTGRLYKQLVTTLGEGFYVRQEQPLTLRDSMPEPDVAVIAGAEGDFTKAHPTTALLAVGVSVTTLDADREKGEIYAEADIAEYWLVRPERGAVEVYTQPRGGFYRERRVFTAAEGATLVSTAVPALRLDLATFFAA